MNTELKTFCITFGQKYRYEQHPTCPLAHPDRVALISAMDVESARVIAHSLIGNKWAFIYPETDFDWDKYPKGSFILADHVVPSVKSETITVTLCLSDNGSAHEPSDWWFRPDGGAQTCISKPLEVTFEKLSQAEIVKGKLAILEAEELDLRESSQRKMESINERRAKLLAIGYEGEEDNG